MGNKAGKLTVSSFEEHWRKVSTAPQFESSSREERLSALLEGVRGFIPARTMAGGIVLASVIAACLQRAFSSPYSDAIYGCYLLTCKHQLPTAPDMDPLFAQEVHIDPHLWHGDLLLSARPYVKSVLESADLSSFLSLLPKEMLRTLLYSSLDLSPTLLDPVWTRYQLNYESICHHGNLLFGWEHQQSDYQVYALNIDTGLLVWNSAPMSSQPNTMTALHATSTGYLAVHTKDDTRIFRPPQRHAVHVITGDCALAVLGRRIFLMEPSKKDKLAFQLAEISQPDQQHFTMRSVAKIALPRVFLPAITTYNIYAFHTSTGDIVVALSTAPELAAVCYPDTGKVISLNASFLLGTRVTPPVSVGDLLYFLDLTDWKRVVVFKLVASDFSLRPIAKATFRTWKHRSSHYLGVVNDRVVAVVLGTDPANPIYSTFFLIEMEAATATLITSTCISTKYYTDVPFHVHGGYIIVGTPSGIEWHAIATGNWVGTDTSVQVPRNLYAVGAIPFFAIWGGRVLVSGARFDELRCYKASSRRIPGSESREQKK